MVEGVGVLEEGVVLVGDGELDFAEDVPVLDVDENVVGALLEAIDHADQTHILVLLALPHQLVVDLQDLLLPRGTLAPHQVHHLKCDNARIGWDL
jgi:hypothetical protein